MIIRKLEAHDREPIKHVLESLHIFRNDEIEVALELIDIELQNPLQKDYEHFIGVNEEHIVLGYYCVGPRPMTKGTFDLYWIAVNNNTQAQGIGTQLLLHAEEHVKQQQCRLLIAETSSQPHYDSTNKFYLKRGYEQLARIRGFYDINDDLIIYGKYLKALQINQ